MTKRYDAYCLQCCGGGKSLLETDSRKAADRAATGHGYGHTVTVIDRKAAR